MSNIGSLGMAEAPLHIVPSEPTGLPSASYQVRRLLYTSRSQMRDDPAELHRLVEHACVRNDGVGITGMLWFDGVKFIQVLEGDHTVIEETMGRVRNDTRHTDIRMISDREVGSRMFGNWAMRYVDDGDHCTEQTAFLVGYAVRESPKLAREIVEIISATGG